MSAWNERISRRQQDTDVANDRHSKEQQSERATFAVKADEAIEKLGAVNILEDIRRDVWQEGDIEEVDGGYHYRKAGNYYDESRRLESEQGAGVGLFYQLRFH